MSLRLKFDKALQPCFFKLYSYTYYDMRCFYYRSDFLSRNQSKLLFAFAGNDRHKLVPAVERYNYFAVHGTGLDFLYFSGELVAG